MDEAKYPDYKRPELEQAIPDLDLVDDLLEGTRRMHEKSGSYVKPWPDEKQTVYDFRRVRENLFGGLERTLSAAVGMLFAKPPEIEWNQSEELISEHWDNIDASGTSGPVFVKEFAGSGIQRGLSLILVDHSPAPRDEAGNLILVTGENEKDFNLRPVWSRYDRAHILNWREQKINNQIVPVQVTLHESAQVDDGDYGVTTVDRYRVLKLVGGVASWTLWEKQEAQDKEPFRAIDSGVFRNKKGLVADFLPVSVGYAGKKKGLFDATIPLLGVAFSNLHHWLISTDLRFNSEVVGFSQLVIKGEMAKDPKGNPYPIQIGPLTAIQVEKEGDAGWQGPAPEGLDQLEKRAQEKLKEIAQQGLSFLQTDTRAAETAEAKRLDASAENSTLATAAQGIEDAVNTALEHHAWYLGIEKKSAPVLTINRDFESTTMQADMLTAYVNAVANAGLPVRILTNAMQKGGLIGPDEDLDALDAEVMANAEAQAEAEKQALQDQLAAKQNNQRKAA